MINLKFFMLCCIVLFISNVVCGQQNIDSLQKILKSEKDINILADTYNDLAFHLSQSQPDSGIYYGEKALELAKKYKLTDQIHPAYNAIGLSYQSKGMYQISIEQLKKQIPYIKDDNSALSRVYHNIGQSYKFMDNLQAALENEVKAAKLIEDDPDPVVSGAIYVSIGNIYRDLKDYNLSYTYLQKAIQTYVQGTSFGISSKNALIANAYTGIGNLFLVQYQMDSAVYYHKKAIALMENEQNSYSLAIMIENLGDDYITMDKRQEAIEQFDRARQIMHNLQSSTDVGYELYKIANVYRIDKQFTKALSYNDSALVIFTQNGADNYRLACYDLNYRIYDSMGRPAEALKFYKLYISLKDSLNSQSQQNEVLRLKEEFETTQKEQKIKLLETSNALKTEENARQVLYLNIAIVSTIILLVLGLLIWNRYRIKQQLKQLQIRNDIAIDLHDEVGSSLSSIKMLSEIAVLQKDNPDQLKELLSRIQDNAGETAGKMHDIIWMINPKHDQLSGIIQRMENFLFDMCSPKEIRFELQKKIDPNIKLTMMQRKDILLIFKEAVNNAVKYSGAQKITAELTQENGMIRLSISDDGKGFDINTIRRGNGLDSMQIRAEELSGSLSISSTPGVGTKLIVEFPLK